MKIETFGRLLRSGIGSIAINEGKTSPIVEDELGQTIGVSAASIQRYKAGHVPPEMRTVEILSDACVRRGLMGREWLLQFLHAARFPSPEIFISKLISSRPTQLNTQRVYEN